MIAVSFFGFFFGGGDEHRSVIYAYAAANEFVRALIERNERYKNVHSSGDMMLLPERE